MDITHWPADKLAELVADHRLVALHAYWRSQRGDRPCMLRADLHPEDIPRLLPIMLLIETNGAPRRFRYRLIGTELVEFAGRDSTGRYIDRGLYGEAADSMLGTMARVLDGGRPHLTLGNAYWMAGRAWRRTATLLMPLSRDGRGADMLLGGMATAPLDVAPVDPAQVRRFALD